MGGAFGPPQGGPPEFRCPRWAFYPSGLPSVCFGEGDGVNTPADDQQWLTYWVLYSLITLFELTSYKLLEWVPIWSYAKLILTCWLVIPYFSGAAYVYERFVRPVIVSHQSINIWYVPKRKVTFGKPDDILTVAEKYIAEHGTQEFENLIHRADRSVKNSDYSVFDDDYQY